MSVAGDSAQLRVYVFGIVLDALSLIATILTPAVIDDQVFDNLLRDMVTTNPEGDIMFSLDHSRRRERLGVPLSKPQLTLLTSEPVGQTSVACLSLAWRHHELLLSASCLI